ncbi:MAG: 50S ribosomal protein L24 [Elusimicrobia bacterium]|nr:MAG: 50S ribosomal protein L24 [Elusimicrobiota bacterium]
MKKFKLKKKDMVLVIAGKDKGKKGEVIQLFDTTDRVLVSKINLVWKHKKPSQNEPGGREQMEAPIHVSNIMLIDPESEKPTRVKRDTLANGDRTRVSKKTGKVIL